MKFALIDGCAVPAGPAPYIYLVLREAGMTAESIYRGSDARRLLHRHGKRTQREIHADPALAAISNPEGESQHDLHSDGVGNPNYARGARIPDYFVGIDSGTNDEASKLRVEAAARRLGWKVKHPYSRGVEGHHWSFAKRPRPRGPIQFARIVRLRRQLVKAAAA